MIDYQSLGVGVVIENLRRRKRLTQDEVAFRCNIVRKTLSNIERDASVPSSATLLNVLHAMNVTPSEFAAELEKHTKILNHYPYNEDES